MKYISTPVDEIAEKSESEKIRRIHNRVCNVKRSEKIGVKLMQQWEEMYYMRKSAMEEGHEEGLLKGLEEGRAEGRAEGRTEGKLEAYLEMIREGITSVEMAAEKLNISVAEILEKIEKN